MSGGMIQATQEMARIRREMSRWRADRRARREAMRHRLKQIGFAAPVVGRAAFQCFDLCGECGFIMRDARGACPSCGQRAWMDLAHEPTADAVRDVEAERRMTSPTWVKATAAAVTAGSFTALVAATDAASWALGVAVVGIPVAYLLGLQPLSVLLQRLTQRERPHRWRLPMPLPESKASPETTLHGKAELVGDALSAPFSGRRCIAYAVSVLFDTPGDARPAEWVLQEVAATDLQVGEHRFPGNRLLPNGPLAPVAAADLADDLDLSHFLRERGLFISDGDFELFEACIEPGDEVEACVFYGATTAVMIHPAAVGS